jgi:hypothetical protein
MECDVMNVPNSRAHLTSLITRKLMPPSSCCLQWHSCLHSSSGPGQAQLQQRPLSCSPTNECVLCFCVRVHQACASSRHLGQPMLLPKISPFTIQSNSVSNSAAPTSCMLWACALLKPRVFSRSLHPSLELRAAPHWLQPAQ